MVGIEFLNRYLKKPELVDYEVAGNMPIIPMQGVIQNSRGVLDHPGLEGRPVRGIEYRNELNRMFPQQPGGLEIPPGMPGYEMDRKIPPAGLVEIPVDYEVAGGPSFDIGAGGGDEVPGYGPEIPSHMILDSLRRRIPNFDEKRQKIRDAALRGYLRGV